MGVTSVRKRREEYRQEQYRQGQSVARAESVMIVTLRMPRLMGPVTQKHMSSWLEISIPKAVSGQKTPRMPKMDYELHVRRNVRVC